MYDEVQAVLEKKEPLMDLKKVNLPGREREGGGTRVAESVLGHSRRSNLPNAENRAIGVLTTMGEKEKYSMAS